MGGEFNDVEFGNHFFFQIINRIKWIFIFAKWKYENGIEWIW